MSSLIKNDIAIAAKKRFYFDENGAIQVNKNAPSHYTVSPSKVVKKRWGVDEDIGMNVPANMRTTEQHGKGVAYDLEYGGPTVNAPDTWRIIDESKVTTLPNGNKVFHEGYVVSKGHQRIVHAEGAMNNLPPGGNFKIDKVETHFTSNAEETLRKLAADKNASFEVGKVKFGSAMEETFLIELTPDMLTPYVQYFKHGGLVEAIPYNPLRSVLDVLGPVGAY